MQYSQQWLEGYDFYWNNEIASSSQNPYNEGTQEFAEWRYGFSAADIDYLNGENSD